ncbi:MAG: hypothetical protein ACK452_15475 [Bacteroidota bacterium]|jgi:hypothetical protein
MNYNKEVIEKFTQHVNQQAEGYNYLLENRHLELLATLDAIRGDSKAFGYLMKTRNAELAAFVNAIWDDQSAFKFLMDNKFFITAAMANIINGDEKAIEYLKNLNQHHFVKLALSIQQRIREDNDKNSNIFSMMNIFKKN